jgi:hypothetical protein
LKIALDTAIPPPELRAVSDIAEDFSTLSRLSDNVGIVTQTIAKAKSERLLLTPSGQTPWLASI